MRILLFTTESCSYCGPAKELIKNANIKDVEFVNAAENMELAREFGIRSVPTVVLSKCSGNQTFTGLDEIQNFIKLMTENSSCGCGCGNH